MDLLLILAVLVFACCPGLMPMKALRLKFADLLASDPTTLAPAADENKIALVKSNTNENEALLVADLTLADFTGSTAIEGALGAQQVGVNPVTGQQIITILAPAGGYRWEATDAVNLPQTIYGYALLNNAGTVLLGYKRLALPVTLNAATQFIDIGAVEITMVLQPAS